LPWLIDGRRLWQAEGLHATALYLDAEDALRAWIDEQSKRDAAAWDVSRRTFPIVASLGNWGRRIRQQLAKILTLIRLLIHRLDDVRQRRVGSTSPTFLLDQNSQ
jgi:hypothetical protein